MKLLRDAATLQILANVLCLIGLVALLPTVFAFLSAFQYPLLGGEQGISSLARELAPRLAMLIPVSLIFLVSGVLWLVAVYAKLIPSASRFARWREKFSTPSKMIKYGYWGALALGILAIAIIVLAFASIAPHIGRGAPLGNARFFAFLGWLFGGLALGFVAAILTFVGWLGLIIMLFDLSSETNIGGFRTAAILFIVDFILSVFASVPIPALLVPGLAVISGLGVALTLAAWYVVRDSAGRALGPAPPPPPPPPAPV